MSYKIWYLAPEALAIIATLRGNPPKLERFTKHYPMSVDEWFSYTGHRFERLAELSHSAFDEISDTPVWDKDAIKHWHRNGDASDVINAVLNTPHVNSVNFHVTDEKRALCDLIRANLADALAPVLELAA